MRLTQNRGSWGRSLVRERGANVMAYVGIFIVAVAIIIGISLVVQGSKMGQVIFLAMCRVSGGQNCEVAAGRESQNAYPNEWERLKAEFAKKPKAKYLVNGDSYISGEGGFDYLGNAKDPSYWCHRSAHASTLSIKKSLNISGENYINRTCSGVVSGHLAGNGQYGEGPQQDVENPEDVLLYEISITGNDLGFKDVLTECARPNGPIKGCTNNQIAQKLEKIIKGEIPFKKIGDKEYTYEEYLVKLYSDAQEKFPNSTIVVHGYPRFWAEDQNGNTKANHFLEGDLTASMLDSEIDLLSNGSDLSISRQEKKWMNNQNKLANRAIANAVKKVASEGNGNPVIFVDLYEGMKGHEIDTEKPWIHGIGINPAESNEELGFVDQLKDTFNASVHPNAIGYTEIGNLTQQSIENYD